MEALFATFGIEWKLLLIQAVNFGIVLVVLSIFLFKPLMKVLEERKQVIAKGVKDAEHAARAKAESEAEAAGRVAIANKEAEAIVARAADEGKKEREAIVRAANERADLIRKDAELQAAEVKQTALRESEKEIARAAILAAEKLLSAKL